MTNFAAYFSLTIALWAVSLLFYVRLTPYHEVELARKGNMAAALSLSGTAIGLALPLASLAEHSVSIADLLMWAAAALVAQLVLWVAIERLVFRNLKQDIEEGKTSVGMLLGALSAGVGILNAACLTY